MYKKFIKVFFLTVLSYSAKSQNLVSDTVKARVKIIFIDSIQSVEFGNEHHFPIGYLILGWTIEEKIGCNSKIVLRVNGRDEFKKMNIRTGENYNVVVVRENRKTPLGGSLNALPIADDCAELVLKESGKYIYRLLEISR